MAESPQPPSPPESIPTYINEGLTKQDPETLRDIAGFAMDLADYQDAHLQEELEAAAVDDETLPPEEWDRDDWEATLEDVDAPGKATLTVKTINDNDYYYYQWREGDAIKSEYIAPVSPSE